jgi:hypothetical protein
MDEIFRKERLESLSKAQIINIILDPRNSQYFINFNRPELESQDKAALVNIILRFPNAHIDNNILADFRHQKHKQVFDVLAAALYRQNEERKALLGTYTIKQFLDIITDLRNKDSFFNFKLEEFLESLKSKYPKLANTDVNRLASIVIGVKFPTGNQVVDDFLTLVREKLYQLLLRHPEVEINGHRVYDPFFWKPLPNQFDHIERLFRGLTDPTNEHRVAWDGSGTGKGKTKSAELLAFRLKVRNVLIICPDPVVLTWHRTMEAVGVFDYRIATYSGIKGTTKDPVQWAKYKPDPTKLSVSEELDWLRITKTGKKGKFSKEYDWSFLPDEDEHGLGGTLVIWDEAQNAKNPDSKIGYCFTSFINYLHREPKKYVKCLMLSGSLVENPEDLSFLMKAYGYISNPTTTELNKFVRERLVPNFKVLIDKEWKPEMEQLSNEEKLIKFIRVVIAGQNRFSQIPEPIPYIIYLLGFIPRPDIELKNEFRDKHLIPRFREYIGEENWQPIFDSIVEPEHFIRAWLGVLAKDPKYAKIQIQEVLDTTFDNPITFQPVRLRSEDMTLFRRLNRELGIVLQKIATGEIKMNQGGLGAVQKALSALEVLKLTPFTALAKSILNTPYENGAKASVCIAMTRNASVRHFAWRLEAFLQIQELENKPYLSASTKTETLKQEKEKMIKAILDEYEKYAKEEQQLIKGNHNLRLKSQFEKYSEADLRAMSLEDVAFEYNKWIKYLYVNLFHHVCIYVGDFGNNPSNYDPDSPDMEDWIKEPKPMDRTMKDRMKDLFQTNQRRVFITNIQSAKEGIDLHDVSEEGMHPRTAIISPGIVARYLVQMFGRFVRAGQTSNAIRIVGFIDDTEDVISWEAKFMVRLNKKIKTIELLHTGESSLDIQENIEEGGGSLISQVISDLKMGSEYKLIDQQVTSYGNREYSESSEGETSRPVDLSVAKPGEINLGAVQDYFRKNYAAMKKSPGEKQAITIEPKPSLLDLPEAVNPPINPNPVPLVKKIFLSKLFVEMNSTHIYFDTSSNEDSDKVNRDIVRGLVLSKVDPKYYKIVVDNPPGTSGVIIFRPGLVATNISQPEMIKNITATVGLELQVSKVEEKALDYLNFSPEVEQTGMIIVLDSPTEMRVYPRYAIEVNFPKLLLSGDLSIEPVDQQVVRFKGTPQKIIAAYYALMALSKLEKLKPLVNFKLYDVNNVLGTTTFVITNMIQDGVYYLIGNKDLIKAFAAILLGLPSLTKAAQNREVFGTLKEGNNNLGTIEIKQPHREAISTILGMEPGVVEGNKVLQNPKAK